MLLVGGHFIKALRPDPKERSLADHHDNLSLSHDTLGLHASQIGSLNDKT